MRSKVMIKTSVCWPATFSIEETYILKMEFIKPGTQGLRCSNLQSGSQHSLLCITMNIL